MHLEIRHLKTIVAITEERTVTRAAERLFITQSALSHQLKEIESRLQTPLFLRVKRKMVLTDAGRTLLEYARRILAEVRKAETEISRIGNGKAGRIRLSTECYTCYHWLPPLLQKFEEKNPGVEVEIVADATKKPVEWLLDGKLDLAITSPDGELDPDLDYHLLFEDEMVVVMSPEHRLAQKKSISPKDFALEHLILYGELRETMVYKRILRDAGVRPERVSQVQLTEAIIQMVKANLGIGVLARWAVRSSIESGEVISKPLGRKGFPRRWYAATLKQTPVPAFIPPFIELVKSAGEPER